jgi:hypothetical protein
MSAERAEKARSEVLDLMKSVRFGLGRDVYLEGPSSSVSILIRNRGEDGSFHLTIRCSGPGNLLVDWQGIALRLDEEKKNRHRGDRWIRILNQHGQVDFRGKISDRQQFQGFLLTASQSTVIVGRFPRRVILAATEKPGALPYYRAISKDKSFAAEAEMYPGGRINVIVQAIEPDDLVNGVVHGELWTRAQNVPDCFEFPLDQTRNGKPCGTWEFTPELPAEAELRLCAFRA